MEVVGEGRRLLQGAVQTFWGWSTDLGFFESEKTLCAPLIQESRFPWARLPCLPGVVFMICDMFLNQRYVCLGYRS